MTQEGQLLSPQEMWRCQSTEAAKPRQHIGYISPNRTQATKATLSDPYNEGYESTLHVFDLQHLVATEHATQRLPRPTTSSQRAEFVPHNTHNTRAHPDASSDAPDADETPTSEPETGTSPKRTNRPTLQLPDLPQARLDRVSSIRPCCNAESPESTPYGTTRAHIKRITPICHPHMPSFTQTSCRPDYSDRST